MDSLIDSLELIELDLFVITKLEELGNELVNTWLFIER